MKHCIMLKKLNQHLCALLEHTKPLNKKIKNNNVRMTSTVVKSNLEFHPPFLSIVKNTH